MATDDVEALRRDLADLRADVNKRLDSIQGAVERLAARAYIPGPSVWKRIGCWLGLVRLG